MGQQHFALPLVKIRKNRPQLPQGVARTAPETAVNHQQRPRFHVLQHGDVAPERRLQHNRPNLLRQRHMRHAALIRRAVVLRHEARKAVDVLKRLARRLVPLVQLLHDEVRVIGELVRLFLRQAQKPADFRREAQVKHGCIQLLFAGIVRENLHRAQRRQLLQQRIHHARLFDVQPHFQRRMTAVIRLAGNIGDVDVMAVQHFQNRHDRARMIRHVELRQNNLRVRHGFEESRLIQFALDGTEHRVVRLNIQKQRVRIHCFVVAHAHDVPLMALDNPACRQKRAALVGHVRHE